MQRFICAAFGLMLAASIVGCAEKGPAVYPVTGKLTIGGQPASGVSMTFQASGTQESASAVIDAQGNYTLYSGVEGKPGAAPGKYKVVLTQAAGGEAYQSGGGGQRSSAAPVAAKGFPEEWTTAAKSPKEVEVKAETNKIDIDVPAAGA